MTLLHSPTHSRTFFNRTPPDLLVMLLLLLMLLLMPLMLLLLMLLLHLYICKGGHNCESEGHDRTHIQLPGMQVG
jgi:hypothetical protein